MSDDKSDSLIPDLVELMRVLAQRSLETNNALLGLREETREALTGLRGETREALAAQREDTRALREDLAAQREDTRALREEVAGARQDTNAALERIAVRLEALGAPRDARADLRDMRRDLELRNEVAEHGDRLKQLEEAVFKKTG
jgi:hypothetical protein